MIALLHGLCTYQHQRGDHKVACTRTTIMFLIKNSDRDEDTQGESGVATQAVVRPKKPNLYQVVLLNDGKERLVLHILDNERPIS